MTIFGALVESIFAAYGAIESLEREQLSDLHYSGVLSISREDALRLKSELLECIGRAAEMIKNSKEEELYSFCLDFFSLRK